MDSPEANLDLRALAKEAADAADRCAEADDEAVDELTPSSALPAPAAVDASVRLRPGPNSTSTPADLVVIVGAGELGPFGSSRTRFEMEVDEQLSAAGVLELAWNTGLIVWENDPKPGWYDVESGDLVPEAEIADKYHDAVVERAASVATSTTAR